MNAPSYLNAITSTNWRRAPSSKREIIKNALAALGFKTIKEFLDDYRARVATVTFLAGAGTRWIESVERAHAEGRAQEIDPAKPRCLAPVADVENPGEAIPLGVYNLRAIQGISDCHVVVWRSHWAEINDMAKLAGMSDVIGIRQETLDGRSLPLGHGDAMRQVLPRLGPEIEYVVANFGGDADSKETITIALLVLIAMRRTEGSMVAPWGILPVTFLSKAKYPIQLNDQGLPVSFRHPKLMGAKVIQPGPSNAGAKIYCRVSLSQVIDCFRRDFMPGQGYAIEDNIGNEFSLDNVDNHLAARLQMRLLNIASVEETNEVKRVEDIDAYLQAQRSITNRERADL